MPTPLHNLSYYLGVWTISGELKGLIIHIIFIVIFYSKKSCNIIKKKIANITFGLKNLILVHNTENTNQNKYNRLKIKKEKTSKQNKEPGKNIKRKPNIKFEYNK